MSRADGKPTQKMLDYAYDLARRLEEDVPWCDRSESFAGTGVKGYPAEPTFDEVSSYISDAKSRWEASDEYRDEMLADEARMDCIDFRRDW